MLSARFSEALVLAVTLHANDRRKGTTVPYVSHLLGVCSLVLNDGGDEDEAIAALLHDALEDHGDAVTASELEARFGMRVRDLVVSYTDYRENLVGTRDRGSGVRGPRAAGRGPRAAESRRHGGTEARRNESLRFATQADETPRLRVSVAKGNWLCGFSLPRVNRIRESGFWGSDFNLSLPRPRRHAR